METVVDANAPLDYIDFLIFPSQNRYEAWVSSFSKKEKVTTGLLEHLLQHSAEVKALHSKGSDVNYTLKPPENPHDINWFTKSTLIRFLHTIGSANIVDITNALKNEISQLEEARKFHLSLYAKDTEYQLQSKESDSGHSNAMGSNWKVEGSDASKNELLCAMDLRLAALREELSTAFDQATGYRYSVEEMTGIEKFSLHFGSDDLRDSLCKTLELRQGSPAVGNSSSKPLSMSDEVGSKEVNNYTTQSLSAEAQVIYGVSPAKVAQVERQSSTEIDESSFSSEEEQPPVERSRTLIRSASPRRSASPMRRIQIGRSGSRRPTAITIKSLNYFPVREKSFFPKDGDSDEEGSEQAPKRSENNVRISVQDAINLFERKQRDQTVDSQKAKSNASVGASKPVLRRWSSEMGEESSQPPQNSLCENSVTESQNNVDHWENVDSSPEAEVNNPTDPFEQDRKLSSSEERAGSLAVMQPGTMPNESIDAIEKRTASTEWSRQKEAELSELLMKMKETKPAKSRKVVPNTGSKRQSLPSELRGGFHDDYKEKRDEKLRGEAARKRTEKDKQLKAMQQILDARKSQLNPAKANDAVKKYNVKKLQKPQKADSQPTNPKTEGPKLGVVKKASPRSSLPATRKSWPSPRAPGPSPRASGSSPAKTPVAASSTGKMPARKNSQPPPPVSQSRPKVEMSNQPRTKSFQSNQQSGNKSLRSSIEKKQQPIPKPIKTMKTKVQTAPENPASAAKLSLYSKVAKKSSVVPLESKPFLRRGSGTISSVKRAVKKKISPNTQEPLRRSVDPFLPGKTETISHSSDDLVILPEEREIEDSQISKSPPKFEDEEGFSPANPIIEDGINRVVEPELLKAADEVEESTISPTAWVEIEEHEDQPVSSANCMGSPTYVAQDGRSSSRVRHSLSQMLLEESSEPDVVDWGNAENPPPMIFQKDAPKGLKRLLKFARKSKNDANSSSWSSPSVFSEGEDDAEDSKIVNNRSTENLPKKATLHSINNGHHNTTDHEQHPAQPNISKPNVRTLSQQIHEAHLSSTVTTTKATRSFFSLSAFKGGK